MKKFALTFLTALALLALPAHAEKLDQWIKLLPKNTVGLIAVKSAPELVADWEKSGFAKMMKDEEFLKWTAPAREDGEYGLDKKFKEETGEGMADFLKRIQGSVLVAFAGDSVADFDGDDAPFVMLLEVGDQQAKIEELIKKDEDDDIAEKSTLKKITKDVAGVPLHILAESEEADASWKQAHAFVDGVMVMGDKPALVEHFIAALKSGAADPSEVVNNHLGRLASLTEGNTDVMIYLNGETLTKWLQDGVAETMKGGKNAAMPMDPKMIFDALGVSELQSIAIMLDVTDTQTRVDVAILHPEKPQGFVSLMRGTTSEVTPPAFLPPGILSGDVSRQSLGNVYDGLLRMVNKLGPLAMMATMQIGQIEQQLGFKIKEDLLGSLDDEYVQAADGSADSPSQVMGLKVKDRARLVGALDGLKRFVGNGFGAFEESEYLGFSISTFKASMGAAAGGKAQEIAYCLTNDYLLFSVGKQDLLKKILTRIKDPGGPSLWDAPRTQELIAMLPKGYYGVGVADASRQMTMGIDALNAVQSKAGASKGKSAAKKKGPGKGPKSDNSEDEPKAAADGPETWFDPAAKPTNEMFQKYFGSLVSGTYAHPDSIQIRILSKPVEVAQ